MPKSKKKGAKPPIHRVGARVWVMDSAGSIIAVSGDDVGIQWDDGRVESVKWADLLDLGARKE